MSFARFDRIMGFQLAILCYCYPIFEKEIIINFFFLNQGHHIQQLPLMEKTCQDLLIFSSFATSLFITAII